MFAVWFTFENNDEIYLSEIITKLASRYGAPVFLPHITAYGLVDSRVDELDKIVSGSIKDERGFTIEKKAIAHSDDFWKTVFVEIHPNDHLTRINKQLEKSLGPIAKYEFKPHISLIYKKMTQEQRGKMAQTLDVKSKFRINGMCIQQFSEDISEWKIVSKYDLQK